jgi:hypothetical protein
MWKALALGEKARPAGFVTPVWSDSSSRTSPMKAAFLCARVAELPSNEKRRASPSRISPKFKGFLFQLAEYIRSSFPYSRITGPQFQY